MCCPLTIYHINLVGNILHFYVFCSTKSGCSRQITTCDRNVFDEKGHQDTNDSSATAKVKYAKFALAQIFFKKAVQQKLRAFVQILARKDTAAAHPVEMALLEIKGEVVLHKVCAVAT